MPHACYHHFTCGSMKIFKNCLTQNIFHFHDYLKGVLATETPKIHLFRDKRKNIPNPFPPFNFKTVKFEEKEHQTIKRLSTVNDCNNKKLYRMKHLKKTKITVELTYKKEKTVTGLHAILWGQWYNLICDGFIGLRSNAQP